MSTFVYTRYPDNYDTPGIVDDSKGLPIIVDMQTPVKAEVVNRHREAILAIEGELGLQPSGTYDTVRARLDALDGVLGSLNANPVNILIDGVQVVAGVTDLNFVGDGVSVVSSGGHGVTVSITGSGGSGTGTGSDPEHERLAVAYNGQTSFTLANAPSDGILLLFISGIKQQISDYTVVGQYLTWNGPQTLLTSDVVEVLYFLVGGSGGGGGGSIATTTSMRQEIFTATNGQSVYVLQGSPINQQATEFFINGVSQAVGIDYTVSGAIVTYIGDIAIVAGNEISIKYFETISSASAASNSTMHQTTFIATEGQVVYVLPYLPISEQSTEFFINGLSQTIVTDYTLDGYTITYVGDVEIHAGNTIVVKYFELLSFSSAVIQLEKSSTIYNINKITCDDSIDVVISGTEAVLTSNINVDGYMCTEIITDDYFDTTAINGVITISVSDKVIKADSAYNSVSAVSLSTNSSTPVLAVTVSGLGISKTYSAVIGARIAINTTGTPANCGYIDIVAMSSVVTDGSAVATFTFDVANISIDYSKLKPAISSVSSTIAASTGGFTISATRVTGVSMSVSSAQAWLVTIDEVV